MVESVRIVNQDFRFCAFLTKPKIFALQQAVRGAFVPLGFGFAEIRVPVQHAACRNASLFSYLIVGAV